MNLKVSARRNARSGMFSGYLAGRRVFENVDGREALAWLSDELRKAGRELSVYSDLKGADVAAHRARIGFEHAGALARWVGYRVTAVRVEPGTVRCLHGKADVYDGEFVLDFEDGSSWRVSGPAGAGVIVEPNPDRRVVARLPAREVIPV